MNKNTLKRLEHEAKAAELLNSYMMNKKYYLHHKAMTAGYTKRTTGGHIQEYHGQFGDGIIVHIPGFNGTKYHYVYYFIEK